MTHDDDVPTQHESTSPPEPTHEATTPPGNQEADADRTRQAEEDLEKPGGGH